MIPIPKKSARPERARTDFIFPPAVFLRDARRLGLPSESTLRRMGREDGLPIHQHRTRGKFIKTTEYLAHLDAMDVLGYEAIDL